MAEPSGDMDRSEQAVSESSRVLAEVARIAGATYRQADRFRTARPAD